jgi:hypothetical protein
LRCPPAEKKIGAQGGAAAGGVGVLGKAALRPKRNPQSTRQAQLRQALAGARQQALAGGGGREDGGSERAGIG